MHNQDSVFSSRLVTIRAVFVFFLSVTGCTACASATPKNVATISRYTSLLESDCQLVPDSSRPSDESLQRCPGTDGYALLVSDADARMTVTVIPPSGELHPLDFQNVVTRHFSSLGSQAEWRLVKSAAAAPKVLALIIRVKALEDADSTKETSWLAVARIGGDGPTCVIGRVAPGETANARAREIADHARTAACLKPLDE